MDKRERPEFLSTDLLAALEHLWPWTQREPATEQEQRERDAAVAEAEATIAEATDGP